MKFTRGKVTRHITVKVSASRDMPSSGGTNIVYLPQKVVEKDVPERDTSDNDNVYLSCSVSDTGKGLTEDDHDVLFNRFAQSSPKTYIEYGGSGLGLFISRHITELMGGQIGVSRRQDLGSTFSFFIKTRKVQQDQVGPEFSFTKRKSGLDIGDAVSAGTLLVLDTPLLTPSESEVVSEMQKQVDKLLVS